MTFEDFWEVRRRGYQNTETESANSQRYGLKEPNINSKPPFSVPPLCWHFKPFLLFTWLSSSVEVKQQAFLSWVGPQWGGSIGLVFQDHKTGPCLGYCLTEHRAVVFMAGKLIL